MKTLIQLLFVLISTQSYGQLDTMENHYYHSEFKYRVHADLRTYGKQIVKYIYTEGPNIGEEMDSATVAKIQIHKSNPDIKECAPCWLKSYNQNGLYFEGEFYFDCCVGLYFEYHSNGSIAKKGQYFSLEEVVEDEEKSCIPIGIWNYYNEGGGLIREVNYSTFYDTEKR